MAENEWIDKLMLVFNLIPGATKDYITAENERQSMSQLFCLHVTHHKNLFDCKISSFKYFTQRLHFTDYTNISEVDISKQ